MVETVEIKTGFKQTEVGVIPEDWEVLALSEVCTMKSGETITSKNIFSTGAYPCYGGNGLRGFTQVFTHKGDYALVGRQGALCGNVQFVTGQFFASEHAVVVAPNKDTNIKWLSFVLARMNLNQYSESSAQPGLSVSKIKQLRIPLPPTKAEQTAIATALSDMDALIEAQEKLIAKKRAIKEGAMQELLRPKEGWGVSELQDLANVIDPHPSHRAPKMQNSGVPFVGIGDLSKNGDIIGNKLRIVDYQIFEEHKLRYNLSHQLIGLGRVASIGKVVRLQNISEPYTISPTLGIIDAKESSHEYLYHVLNSKFITDQFRKIMSGSTRSSVGMIVLRTLKIPIPPTNAEQTRIAQTLSDMDDEIERLEVQLAKYQQIKRGMMQDLLTGKKRLISTS